MPKRRLFVADAALGHTHTEAYFGHNDEVYVEAGLAKAKFEVGEFSAEANLPRASAQVRDTSTGPKLTIRAELASVEETEITPKRRRIVDSSFANCRAEASAGDDGAEVSAEIGIGKGEFEVGAINAAANVFKLSGEAKLTPTEAGAMTRADVLAFSVGAGPLKVKVGRSVDTGFKVGNDGVELKVLGDGIKAGKDGVEVKVMGNGLTLRKDAVGVEVLGTGFKAGEHGLELKVFGIGVEFKF